MTEHLPSVEELIRRTPGRWGEPLPADGPFDPAAAASSGPPGPVEPATPPLPWRPWFRYARRALLVLFGLFLILFAWLAFTAPLSKSLKPIAPPSVTLLASDGTPIARKGAIIDKPVAVKALPKHVTQAFVAIEDRRFYSHLGIDPRGLARAAWNNIRSTSTQGGSTITQQLAKMVFLSPERNFTRKAREMLIAFWLEAWLTKDQILERYLSNAYFGDNVYGLRAASLHYFDRPPERLTLSQSAMLAGLVQAPSRLAPTRNLKGARARGRLVLGAMADAGFITEAKARATRDAVLDVRAPGKTPTGTYFADWAMPQARAVAEQSYGDAKVTTTLDARLQRFANQATAVVRGRSQVALVAMRPTGEVVAMVGGRAYKKSPFNRATQARRQPGSTFKLFVYLAALRSGMTPDSLVDDSPITEGQYRPKNSQGTYRGQITLKQAFARSSNVAAVRLYRQVGGEAVIRAARDLGIRSPLADDPTLALGSQGVTLLELTSAFAAVSANHYPVPPRAVAGEGPGLFDRIMAMRNNLGGTRGQMLELLSGVVANGTGRSATLAIPAYGKTGTSQNNRDAWFVGFAGDLVVGVWVGNDDNSPLAGVHGGGLPARIWRDFMGRAVPGARPAAPPPPPVVPEESITGADLPILNATELSVDDSGLSVDTRIGDVPVGVRIDRDGVSINPGDEGPEPRRREDEPTDVPVDEGQ